MPESTHIDTNQAYPVIIRCQRLFKDFFRFFPAVPKMLLTKFPKCLCGISTGQLEILLSRTGPTDHHSQLPNLLYTAELCTQIKTK